MGRRRPEFEGLDDVVDHALGDEGGSPEAGRSSARPAPAPGRAASRLGPLVFEGMDALADGLLSERTPPPAAQDSDTGLLQRDGAPGAYDEDDQSISQVLDVFEAFDGSPPRRGESTSALGLEGPIPSAPASEASTEVATAEGIGLSSPASLGPSSGHPLAAREPTPVAPSRALDEAGFSRAHIEDALAAAEGRRLEIAPRVEVDETETPRVSVLLAAGGALLLGLLVFYLLSAAPAPEVRPAAPAATAPR